jgi:carboxyl-terminal processing protease
MRKALPAAAIVVGLSALAGGMFGSKVAARQDRANERYRMYLAALDAIQNEYVEPFDQAQQTQLVYGSIDGMLRTLDPHSAFLDPRSFAQMRERQVGAYFGIGISILSIDGEITVVSLFEGSPAYRAGIRRNDIIARVGKEETKAWGPDPRKQTEEVVRHIKGPRGTTVDISIRRPGVDQLIDLTVERDEIHIVTVRTAFMMAPGVGYIRLQDFSETSNAEVTSALAKLKSQGMEKLVLDLRDNPGGPLDQAIAVSNQFLKKGQMIVFTKGRVTTEDEYVAVEEGAYTAQPLIVLTNRNSASASEIVTGAMQDHDRAIVVGESTFGKALVQSVYSIHNNAGLALTTGRYYTPSGRLIQRPWDGSFDEYLTYGLRDQSETKPHSPAELKYTDSGRKVYGGGGIEPDHFIAGPVEGFNPTRFTRLLQSRGAFIGFAEKFTKEGDNRPAARSAATHKVAPGWVVTDAIVEEFKQYVTGQRVRIDEASFKTDLPFIKAMIHFEVDMDLFSFEEARKNLVRVDPQAQAALGRFDEAKQLLMARKGQ